MTTEQKFWCKTAKDMENRNIHQSKKTTNKIITEDLRKRILNDAKPSKLIVKFLSNTEFTVTRQY
jgi:hypothetical protein